MALSVIPNFATFEVLILFLALLIGSALISLSQTKFLSLVRDLRTKPAEKIRDIKEFANSYWVHPAYRVSSLIGSILAILSGLTNPYFFGFLALITFVGPAALFYKRNSPFGLRCRYIAVGEDQGHDCRPREGTYTVQLEMTPGDDVEDYRLDIHTPSGAELDRIDGNYSHLDEERQILYGFINGQENETLSEALYIKKTGSISPDGELVLIKSQGEDYTMEWIQLLPPE